MAVIHLIGQRIGYSASPAMQRAAFAALGLDHAYELADVDRPALAHAVARLREVGCLGANVTVPYKSSVVEMLDEVDPLGRRIGAVNTIVQRDGRLFGTNTDVAAIAEQASRLRRRPRNALVLGAGGAARAVSQALTEIGAGRITLVARSAGDGVVGWSELPELVGAADLLVNATPVGTDSDETPVPSRWLHRRLAVLDLVYRPSPTRLVRDARSAGAPACAGAGVLIGQGWRSLAEWLGRPVPARVVTAMARALRSELGEGADA